MINGFPAISAFRAGYTHIFQSLHISVFSMPTFNFNWTGEGKISKAKLIVPASIKLPIGRSRLKVPDFTTLPSFVSTVHKIRASESGFSPKCANSISARKVSSLFQTSFGSLAKGTVWLQNIRYSFSSTYPLLSQKASNTPTKAVPCPGKSCKSNSWKPPNPGVRRAVSISVL